MVIISTNAVEVSIQAVSPVSSFGASWAWATRVPNAPSAKALRRAFCAPVFKWVLMFIGPLLGKLCGSQRIGVGFAGADTHGMLDRQHEDLAVAYLPGLGRSDDRFDRL